MLPYLGQNKCEKGTIGTFVSGWFSDPYGKLGDSPCLLTLGGSQIVWDFPLLIHTIEKQ